MSVTNFTSWLRENWPHPPDHVLARLRHTLDVCDHPDLGSPEPDDKLVVEATGNIYIDKNGKPVRTGLTWGDLRTIRAYLDHGVEGLVLLSDRPVDLTPRPTIR